MQTALEAIVEPRRREILRLVWANELPAGQIASHFDVSRPAISKHLRVLREAGLVVERRNGTQRLYRARREAIAELYRLLEGFWDESLLTIKAAAESKRNRPER
jgi:DNA-binding transcriptional ArsR family regulator